VDALAKLGAAKQLERQLWERAAVACVNSNSCTKLETPALYADTVVKAWRERYWVELIS
jgi:hypothetical protein